MLKKLNNESVTIISAVASGLIVDALFPSISELLNVIGGFFENTENKQLIDLLIASLNVFSVFVLFLVLWRFCTYFLPTFIRFYEKHKKIRYIPKSSSEEITLFYKVFVETTKLEKNSQSIYDSSFQFTIMLNKTLDLCHRLILATSHYKNKILLNCKIFRTEDKNQHFLNYRKFINSYDYTATIDVLLKTLQDAKKVYYELNLNSKLMLNDIDNAVECLAELKKQIFENT